MLPFKRLVRTLDYMSLPPPQANSQADLPSPRYRFKFHHLLVTYRRECQLVVMFIHGYR